LQLLHDLAFVAVFEAGGSDHLGSAWLRSA
jgi:hypothetical protein